MIKNACCPKTGGTYFYGQGSDKKSLKNAPGCDIIAQESGCGAAGSAGGLGPSGRRFEPCHSDQKKQDFDFRGPAFFNGINLFFLITPRSETKSVSELFLFFEIP